MVQSLLNFSRQLSRLLIAIEPQPGICTRMAPWLPKSSRTHAMQCSFRKGIGVAETVRIAASYENTHPVRHLCPGRRKESKTWRLSLEHCMAMGLAVH